MISPETTRTVAIVVGKRKIRAERGDVLGLAFGQLRHVERRVLWLTSIDRLTAAEAADVLGLDPAQLGQISFRARARLRRRMAALLRTRAPEPCREFVAELPRYALGAASDLPAPSIRSHLSECARCHAFVHTFLDLPAALRARPPTEPPGITLAVSPEPSPDPSPEPSPERVETPAARPDRPMRDVALGLAVVVLVVVGAAGLVRTTRNPDAGLFAASDPFFAPAPEAAASFDTGTPRPVSDGTGVRGIVIAAPPPATVAPPAGTPTPSPPPAPEIITETAPPPPTAPPTGSADPAPPAGAIAETVAVVDPTVTHVDGVLDPCSPA